jgi:hypothetical protein
VLSREVEKPKKGATARQRWRPCVRFERTREREMLTNAGVGGRDPMILSNKIKLIIGFPARVFTLNLLCIVCFVSVVLMLPLNVI